MLMSNDNIFFTEINDVIPDDDALDLNTQDFQIGTPSGVPVLERSNLPSIYAGKQLHLEIEGGQEVFYKGAYVSTIPLFGAPLIIGRRDVLAGFYPDVDLAMYWKQDRAISRRHLKIYCDLNGLWFVEDLCNHNATFLNSYKYPLNHDRVELHPDDRILISMSIAIAFKVDN